jgi:hypothetical protein
VRPPQSPHIESGTWLIVTGGTDFVVIPAAFYVVVLAARLDFGMLRKEGWLFDVAAEHEVWYKFYTYLGPPLPPSPVVYVS